MSHTAIVFKKNSTSVKVRCFLGELISQTSFSLSGRAMIRIQGRELWIYCLSDTYELRTTCEICREWTIIKPNGSEMHLACNRSGHDITIEEMSIL
jgi:hypothetical protein